MVGSDDGSRVMQVCNLQDYFRTSIDEVVARQQVEIDPHAAHYVVNLLTLYSRSDELYEDDGDCYGLRPLALMLADAADAILAIAGQSGLIGNQGVAGPGEAIKER